MGNSLLDQLMNDCDILEVFYNIMESAAYPEECLEGIMLDAIDNRKGDVMHRLMVELAQASEYHDLEVVVSSWVRVSS